MKFLSLYFLLINFLLTAQSYAPQVGFENNTAISKDSSIIKGWAVEAYIQRAYLDIAFREDGFVSFGSDSFALGKADGSAGVVSLGDGGSAVLTFDAPIANGAGADFVVFENGFLQNSNSNLAFLELAFVEVSSDGEYFVRFPAVSENQSDTQIGSFEFTDARYIHNFAGKYIANYGTPFDLSDIEQLADASLDVNHITHIRITDVVGSINPDYASRDSKNNIVNDPYPTPFTSGGFDLDAVGVINFAQNADDISVYPNPASDKLFIRSENTINAYKLYDYSGHLILRGNSAESLNISRLKNGFYILTLQSGLKTTSIKLQIRH